VYTKTLFAVLEPERKNCGCSVWGNSERLFQGEKSCQVCRKGVGEHVVCDHGRSWAGGGNQVRPETIRGEGQGVKLLAGEGRKNGPQQRIGKKKKSQGDKKVMQKGKRPREINQ